MVDEAAVSPESPLGPEFWQLLLLAELPFVRRESLVDRARRHGRTDWEAFFREAPELNPADRQRITKANLGAAATAINRGAQILERRKFPEKFAALPNAPVAVFVWGNCEALDLPSVGIVGTRGASTYGKAVTRKFAEAFAQAGVAIVSGGAQGVDAAAHEGALEAGGYTICAMSCGIDRAYPAAHRGLFDRIRSTGLLVSQFPAGWNPRHDSFVQRNATIAGLSDAILVIEAPERSGALITANRANEFGRPVYVVPGNISTASFRGSHALIRDGATLVDHPDQILEEMGIGPSLTLSADAKLSFEQRAILSVLGAEPILTDKIAEQSGLDSAAVLSELTMLELDGRILRGPGGYILAP
ncbi:MAG TPA: DNA-processing protein DprA [Fimbriimonadaceae bacterium]|nr:DNA-processing protein DprA [Fimbriimonadaceae bacterium]